MFARLDECGPEVVVAPGPEVMPLWVFPTPLLVSVEAPGKAPGTWDVVFATGSRVFPKCDPSPDKPPVLVVLECVGFAVSPVP